MNEMNGTTICIQDRTAVFFRVPLFPARLIEILRRRRCGEDERELWQWLDEGLALALQGMDPDEQQLAVKVGHMREVELFCAIAAREPEVLFGTWYWLWRHVGSDPAYWIFPSYPDDDTDVRYLESYLDKDALAEDWPELLSAAEICAAAHAA